MYEEAPFDFQREYRKLDGVIQGEIKSHNEKRQEFDREQIRVQMHDFIDAFPETQFPEFVNDLYLWYDILSTALDDSETSVGEVEEITEIFWTIVMIEIATSSETGVKPRIFVDELGIDDPDGLQGYLRYRLDQLEGEYLEVDVDSGFIADVADAVMASQLDFVEI